MERRFSEQEQIRREKVKALKEMGVEPFGYKMDRTHTAQEFISAFDKFSKEELANQEHESITIIGRLRSMRGPFITLEDESGKWQSYVPKKEISEQCLNLIKQADAGDWVAISGTPMKTGTGVLSLRATKYHHLVKSLRALPDDYYGLQDKEERYRRRYVDLIMRPEVKDTFIKRTAIFKYLRNYLDNQGYLEVDTPILQPILGGAAARPFITHHNTLDMEFYLRIATELPLKRCIVGGIPKVYEIGRLFRNEGMDATHNPEFTTIELYEAHADMHDMMRIAEEFISGVNQAVNGTDVITYQGREINLGAPFKKIHMVDFIKQETNVDFWNITDMEDAKIVAKKHNIHLEKHHSSVGHVINEFFETFCEDKVSDPVFVYGHPVEISPLAKKDPKNNRFTERFELFVDQKEIANAFTELNDPIDQYDRFMDQVKSKDAGNDEATEMDLDFVEALEHAMPPTGGMGIGLDRLVMLLTDHHSIRDVLLFPHMKPRG